MKKYLLLLLSVLICTSSINFASAKSTSNPALASAIRLYKAGNYSQCYTALNSIIKKDPSNAVAYYYLAMTSAQIGKKDDAIQNYEKVITLSPDGRYMLLSKTGGESGNETYREWVDFLFVNLDTAQMYKIENLKGINFNVVWMPNGQIYLENEIYSLGA